MPVERVVTILDVHSLLGLGEVDRAEEVLARETRDRPDGGALELAALVRRGEHTRALDVADAAIEALDQRADRLFRSVLARDLVRACIGTGQLARADRMLRLAESAFRRHRPRGDGGADAVIRREDVEGGHEGQGRGARGAGGGVARPRAPPWRGPTRRCVAPSLPCNRERSRRRWTPPTSPSGTTPPPVCITRRHVHGWPVPRRSRACIAPPQASPSAPPSVTVLHARSMTATRSRRRRATRPSSRPRPSCGPRSKRPRVISTPPRAPCSLRHGPPVRAPTSCWCAPRRAWG